MSSLILSGLSPLSGSLSSLSSSGSTFLLTSAFALKCSNSFVCLGPELSASVSCEASMGTGTGACVTHVGRFFSV